MRPELTGTKEPKKQHGELREVVNEEREMEETGSVELERRLQESRGVKRMEKKEKGRTVRDEYCQQGLANKVLLIVNAGQTGAL